jgi:hypothetical protein
VDGPSPAGRFGVREGTVASRTAAPAPADPLDPLTGPRKRAGYTAAERRFSEALQGRLQELLEGRRNRVELLRKYPREPGRLGCVRLPPDARRERLRLDVVERLTWEAVRFLRSEGPGGPVSQTLQPDGSTTEEQRFPTRYPHIVLCRTDRYRGGEDDPVEITWCAQRVQNQREQTQINRLLDAANLAFELIRVIR